MDLRGKFTEIEGSIDYYDKLETICDNFAIGFAEWLKEYYYDGFKTFEELLTIYKETL